MNPEELWHAWAAGFVDGEGALMLSRGNGQVWIHLRVGQNVRAPLERLTLLYGEGKIREVPNKYGVFFQWDLYGEKAVRALRLMRPYFMVKGAQADLIDEYYEKCFNVQTDFGERLEYHERIKEMHRDRQAGNKAAVA